ncbi:hypothetical protein [Nitratidesulfovibrio vulgaris]|uniref:Uncharacterized protein n=1 Tax=Nitratidesulfovibrio vulgaris (strain DP4) TaxID=391774 RepID=A0A0H3A7R5_NITV4|nr:hypothetical protein [Nitratidesulfovibrio vulgaris]ABM28073.1 conserved hypothetical protein [Nitratidesulfovibrio vulgaris DP4]
MQKNKQLERLAAKYAQASGPEREAVDATLVSPGRSAVVEMVKPRGKVEYMPSGYSAKLGIAPRCEAPEAGADRMTKMLRMYPLHVYRIWPAGCGFGFSQGWARDNWNRVMEFHDLFWSEAGDVYLERHRSEIPVMEHDEQGGLRRCAHV